MLWSGIAEKRESSSESPRTILQAKERKEQHSKFQCAQKVHIPSRQKGHQDIPSNRQDGLKHQQNREKFCVSTRRPSEEVTAEQYRKNVRDHAAPIRELLELSVASLTDIDGIQEEIPVRERRHAEEDNNKEANCFSV